MEKKKSEEYVCIEQPFWDFEQEHKYGASGDEEDEEEDEEADDDSLVQRYNDMVTSPEKMFPKPAAEHPEYKWQMMWEAWTMLCDYKTKVT